MVFPGVTCFSGVDKAQGGEPSAGWGHVSWQQRGPLVPFGYTASRTQEEDRAKVGPQTAAIGTKAAGSRSRSPAEGGGLVWGAPSSPPQQALHPQAAPSPGSPKASGVEASFPGQSVQNVGKAPGSAHWALIFPRKLGAEVDLRLSDQGGSPGSDHAGCFGDMHSPGVTWSPWDNLEPFGDALEPLG